MAIAPELVSPDAANGGAQSRSLRLRQTATVLLLFGGYGALYFCRADLSVATPLLVDELGKHGVSHGDAIIRIGSIASFCVFAYALGMLIAHGFGWRTLFYFAAAVVGLFLAVNFLFLRESRLDAGFIEAKPNPLNLFAGSESRPKNVAQLLLPLFRSRAFLVVCVLSLGCTIIRESFNLSTPAYLRDSLRYSASSAARMSSVFPGA